MKPPPSRLDRGSTLLPSDPHNCRSEPNFDTAWDLQSWRVYWSLLRLRYGLVLGNQMLPCVLAKNDPRGRTILQMRAISTALPTYLSFTCWGIRSQNLPVLTYWLKSWGALSIVNLRSGSNRVSSHWVCGERFRSHLRHQAHYWSP